jgi:hypothetical protein
VLLLKPLLAWQSFNENVYLAEHGKMMDNRDKRCYKFPVIEVMEAGRRQQQKMPVSEQIMN